MKIRKRKEANNLEPKQLNIELPGDIHKELSVYCATIGEKKKVVVANVIEEFLKKEREENE